MGSFAKAKAGGAGAAPIQQSGSGDRSPIRFHLAYGIRSRIHFFGGLSPRRRVVPSERISGMRKFRVLLFEVIGLGLLIAWLLWKYPELVDSIIPWVALAVCWHITWEFVLDTKPVRRVAESGLDVLFVASVKNRGSIRRRQQNGAAYTGRTTVASSAAFGMFLWSTLRGSLGD